MTITDAIHAYNVGGLIGYTDQQLSELANTLETKITFMNQVARQESVSAEVKADIRKYELIRDEVARLMEKRADPVTII